MAHQDAETFAALQLALEHAVERKKALQEKVSSSPPRAPAAAALGDGFMDAHLCQLIAVNTLH